MPEEADVDDGDMPAAQDVRPPAAAAAPAAASSSGPDFRPRLHKDGEDFVRIAQLVNQAHEQHEKRGGPRWGLLTRKQRADLIDEARRKFAATLGEEAR